MADKKTFPTNEFKELLITFLENNFKNSKPIVNALTHDESEYSLKNTLLLYNDEIYEMLGGKISEHNDYDYEDLESENDSLKIQIDELENEIGELKGVFGKRLEDEFKMRTIKEYQSDYRYWELEELLKNGKRYLNQ